VDFAHNVVFAGQNNASENFCLLNLPAFLVHTILFEEDEQYRKARNRFDRRDAFFNAPRYTFCRFLYENWLAFILLRDESGGLYVESPLRTDNRLTRGGFFNNLNSNGGYFFFI
jgi:hypothetical protein